MKRLEALRRRMAETALPALLVTGACNRRYLSGFTGSSGILIVTADHAWLLTDFRYLEQARQEAPGWELVPVKGKLNEAIRSVLESAAVDCLGFEKEHLTFSQFERLQDLEVTLRPVGTWVESQRMVKDPGEIECIRRAAAISDAAFEHILGFIRPGRSEQEIALELEYYMRRAGARGAAFEFVVASGPRGSLPHGRPSPRSIRSGDMVTMDMGCIVDGYCSDLTRTVVVGRASEEQRAIYRLVLEAQAVGLNAVRAGKKGSAVDAEVRKVIEEAGHGEDFGHGLGHGVGLEVHEEPRLSPGAAGPDEPDLQAGMVVTVEPGVYIPGWGGVRIEDLVVVQADGPIVLSHASKDLIELRG